MITVEEADTYFASRYNSSLWSNSDTTIKTQVLNKSMQLVDLLDYSGDKTDADQLHAFPRDEDTETPQQVKDAICEVAYAVLDGVDIEVEIPNLEMDSQSYGTIKNTYERKSRPPYLMAGIPSALAWRLLLPYMNDPMALRVNRV